MQKQKHRREMTLFLIVIAASAFGLGLSDSVYGNLFQGCIQRYNHAARVY